MSRTAVLRADGPSRTRRTVAAFVLALTITAAVAAMLAGRASSAVDRAGASWGSRMVVVLQPDGASWS